MITGTITLEGAAELEAKLAALDRKAAGKISRDAMRGGAKIILAQAKKTAPKKTGLLRRSLKIKAGKRKRGFLRFHVQTAKGNYKGETFYGSFLEFGHRLGKRSRGLRSFIKASGEDPRRMIEPKPFMRPAFDAKKDEAARFIITTIRHGIKEAV